MTAGATAFAWDEAQVTAPTWAVRANALLAAGQANQAIVLRRHQGYDHGYYFIQTFIADHVRHHARAEREARSVRGIRARDHARAKRRHGDDRSDRGWHELHQACGDASDGGSDHAADDCPCDHRILLLAAGGGLRGVF